MPRHHVIDRQDGLFDTIIDRMSEIGAEHQRDREMISRNFKPIFEYSDPTTKLPVGAIFGLASNGTNPTLLVAIEARQNRDGQLGWAHAHSRLTSEGGHLKLGDTTIWEFEAKPPPPQDLDNWTYFFLPHD